jgi:hypothetical protein
MRRVYATIIVDFYGDPKIGDCANAIEAGLRTLPVVKGADTPVVIFAGSKFDPAMPDDARGIVVEKEGKPS